MYLLLCVLEAVDYPLLLSKQCKISIITKQQNVFEKISSDIATLGSAWMKWRLKHKL